jgi:hypothetical protein
MLANYLPTFGSVSNVAPWAAVELSMAERAETGTPFNITSRRVIASMSRWARLLLKALQVCYFYPRHRHVFQGLFSFNFLHSDLYCYSCDDARTDDRLQEHLAHFSIEIAKQEKTEKSMTELVCPYYFFICLRLQAQLGVSGASLLLVSHTK